MDIRYDTIICNAHNVCQLAESEARAVIGGTSSQYLYNGSIMFYYVLAASRIIINGEKPKKINYNTQGRIGYAIFLL